MQLRRICIKSNIHIYETRFLSSFQHCGIFCRSGKQVTMSHCSFSLLKSISTQFLTWIFACFGFLSWKTRNYPKNRTLNSTKLGFWRKFCNFYPISDLNLCMFWVFELKKRGITPKIGYWIQQNWVFDAFFADYEQNQAPGGITGWPASGQREPGCFHHFCFQNDALQ